MERILLILLELVTARRSVPTTLYRNFCVCPIVTRYGTTERAYYLIPKFLCLSYRYSLRHDGACLLPYTEIFVSVLSLLVTARRSVPTTLYRNFCVCPIVTRYGTTERAYYLIPKFLCLSYCYQNYGSITYRTILMI